ncbi:MAG: amino acid ABC transporter permease [Pseudomonadota bacterium]|nr:amino acid ABC transporter permease [Pseudomonadota bacterium]
MPYLLGGSWITLHLSFLGFWCGCTIGLFGALAKTYGPRWLVRLVNVYVVFFTNTPGLVTAFFIFFGLPEFGIVLSPYQVVLLNIALNAGAYITEVMRGGFASVRQTELDAAAAMGFTLLQALRYVIVPHIAKVLFAPLSNWYIFVILGTAAASIFGVEELTGRAFNAASDTFRSIEIYIMVACMYVVITSLASALLALIGRWVFRVKVKVF